jgi:two-component system sensor histidine kinase ChvG
MQRVEQTAGLSGAERRRVQAVVETLANLRNEGETVAEVAHDARNMVTALGLYCDLLEEPGVLAAPFLHYGNELRLVAAASRRLVERLVALDRREVSVVAPGLQREAVRTAARTAKAADGASRLDGVGQAQCWEPMPAKPIDSLAAELTANRNLLAALAGPSITLMVDADGGDKAVWLTGEDLTRVLVNLVKNAAEAMPEGGRIEVGLHEFHAGVESGSWLVLTIEDDGPGIPLSDREKIFDSGYTTRAHDSQASAGWTGAHRGLGLAITRSIVEGAGGRIRLANRSSAGARFEIELPVRRR